MYVAQQWTLFIVINYSYISSMKVFCKKIVKFIGVWIISVPIIISIFIPSAILGAIFSAFIESFKVGMNSVSQVIKKN